MNKPESKEEIADQHKDIQSRHCTSEKGTLKISHSLVHESTSCDMTTESNLKVTESALGDSDDDIEDNGSEVNINDPYVDIDVDEEENVESSISDKDSHDLRTRLQAFLEVTAIEKLQDLDLITKLPSSISINSNSDQNSIASTDNQTLVQACAGGDVELFKLMLKQGRDIHEVTEDGESLLCLAASSGYLELCKILLAMNADVEDRGRKGDCSPLMEAACAGYDDIMKLLIDSGADVNAKSSAGNTALHYAACNGHENAVKLLIASGAHVEIHNENGHTPLMEAASSGRVGVAKILLEAGAGINTHSNEFKETALTLACYKGHLELVKYLLQCGADHEHKTDEMHTALMEASMDGHVEVARLLLDSGAQVNMPTDSFESPLTLAACGGHVELANLLLERNANIEEANDEGYTPLMEAAREGHEEMCALLLTHGADINAQTEETQETPLTLACCGGFLEVADFLIRAGADIELGCSTPLMEASQEGHLELVKYLLKSGANVHAKSQSGDTAFTLACENGHTDIAEVLLSCGAELEHQSEEGKTALMKAAKSGHLCTVQFLVNQGADVNKSTVSNDHTVLSLACSGGHMTVVELLLKNQADPSHKLKDGSTMLIEAAKGGHAQVVKFLLEWTGNGNNSNELSPSSPTHAIKTSMQSLNFVPSTEVASNFNNISLGPLNDGRLLWTGLPSQQGGLTAVDNHLSCCYPSNLGAISQQPFFNMHLMTSKQNLVTDNQFLFPTSQLVQKSPAVEESKCSMQQNNQTNALFSALLASNVLTTSPGPTSTSPEQLRNIFKNLELLTVPSEEGSKSPLRICTNAWQQKEAFQDDQISILAQSLNLDTSELIKNQSGPNPSSSDRSLDSPTVTATPINPHSTTLITDSSKDQVLQKVEKCLGDCQISSDELLPNLRYYQVVQMAQSALPSSKNHQMDGLFSSKINSSQDDVEGSDSESNENNLSSPKNQEEICSPKSPDIVALNESDLSPKEFLDVVSKLKKLEFDTYPKAAWQEKEDSTSDCAFFESLTRSCIIADKGSSKGTQEDLQNSMASLTNADDIDLSTIVLLTELQQQQNTMDLCDNKIGNKNAFNDNSNFSIQWSTTGQQLAYPQSQQNSLTFDQATSQLWQQQFEQMLQWQQQQQLVTQQFFQQQHLNQQHLQKPQPLMHSDNTQQVKWNLDSSVSLNAEVNKISESINLSGKYSSLPKNSATSGDYLQVHEKAQKLEFKFESPPQTHKVPSSAIGSSGENSSQPQLKTTTGRVFVRGHRKLPTLQKQQQLAAAVACSSNFTGDPCLHQLQHAQIQPLAQLPGSSHLGLQPHSLLLGNAPSVSGDLSNVASSVSSCNAWTQMPINNHNTSMYVQFHQQQQQLKNNKIVNKQTLQMPQPQGQTSSSCSDLKHLGQSTNTCSHVLQQQHMFLPQQYQPPLDLQPLKQQHAYLSQQERSQAYQQFQLQQLLQQQKVCDAAASLSSSGRPVGSSSGGIATNSLVSQHLPSQELFHKQAQHFPQLVQNQHHQQQFVPINSMNQKHILLDSCGANSVGQQSTKLFNNGSNSLIQSQLFQLMSQQHQQQQQLFLQQHLNLHHPHHVLSGSSNTNNNKSSFLLQSGIDSMNVSSPLSPSTSTSFDTGQLTARCPIEVDAQTEGNHDTALTLACAGGYAELVELLLQCNANIEHRDKKGFSPLILAATGGHVGVVEILLDHNVDIEAQSERTKDTALSLACSGGKYEVVELLLTRGANKEHRNVSDYTPLSLAASGGYDTIINLLLDHGAEINSRTGSKLGISPLMLAAMNGHVSTVKLLLDKGSDINAQIETNRNTALTLACFQGRHEVVSVLLERKANIEHRAKTGLTPLMEAASGGYVEVGKVLLDKGADVNAAPVPSSRDTALTIAADKGHHKFVELLLSRKALVDVKNKKGNSPLWLACNGGHLEVVQHLVHAKADVDSQDNRKVSCLMVAFRKGHIKVVKWLVKHVVQFPSQQDCSRCLSTITDKELLKKCQVCMEIIDGARENQAAEANRNADNLLLELDREKSLEESRKAAAARKREKKKQKKKKRQAAEDPREESNEASDSQQPEEILSKTGQDIEVAYETIASFGNASSEEVVENPAKKVKQNKKSGKDKKASCRVEQVPIKNCLRPVEEVSKSLSTEIKLCEVEVQQQVYSTTSQSISALSIVKNNMNAPNNKKDLSKFVLSSYSSGIGDLDDFGMLPTDIKNTATSAMSLHKEKSSAKETQRSKMVVASSTAVKTHKGSTLSSPKKIARKDEGWKEVTRKCKRITVPGKAISRIIGRGGCNINAIREESGAHIDLDKVKNSADGVVTIKGSVEATKLAYDLIEALIRETDKDIEQLIPLFKNKASTSNSCISLTKSNVSSKLSSSNSTISFSGITNPGKQNNILTSVGSLVSNSGITSVWNRSSKTSTASKSEPIASFTIGAWSPSVHDSAKLPSSSCTAISSQAIIQNVSTSDSFAGSITNAFTSLKITAGLLSSNEFPSSQVNSTTTYKVTSSLWDNQMVKPEASSVTVAMPIMSGGNSGSKHSTSAESIQMIPQYSPFKTFFTSSSLLGRDAVKTNFSGSGICASRIPITLSTEIAVDSALQAKAPGYRPPVSNVSSSLSPRKATDAGPSGKDSMKLNSFPNIEEKVKIPSTKPLNVDARVSSISDGVEIEVMSSAESVVPFLSMPVLSSHNHREEYISSKNPMTLPHIDSNLNPNAPDFTSKTSLEFGPKMITTGPQVHSYYPTQVSLPSYSLFSSSLSDIRFPQEMKSVTYPLTSGVVSSVKEIPAGVSQTAPSAVDCDSIYDHYSTQRLDQSTPSSSNPSSPNVDDRRSIQPIGTELRSKKQRIAHPHPPLMTSSASYGFGYSPNLHNYQQQQQWQTPYQGEIGNGDWRSGSVNSASEPPMDGMSNVLVPRPGYFPHVMGLRHPDMMRSQPELITPQPIRPPSGDHLYENTIQTQHGSVLAPHGTSAYMNGYLSQNLPNSYMPNLGMLRSAGDGWENGHRMKMPNNYVWNGWQQNPNY